MYRFQRPLLGVILALIITLPLGGAAQPVEPSRDQATASEASLAPETPEGESDDAELEPDQTLEDTTTLPTELSASDYQTIVDALEADSPQPVSAAPAMTNRVQVSQSTQQSVQTPSSMNPAIALIIDVAFAYFDTDEPLQLGAHDPNSTGFTLQQLEFHAESKIDPYFDMQANLGSFDFSRRHLGRAEWEEIHNIVPMIN